MLRIAACLAALLPAMGASQASAATIGQVAPVTPVNAPCGTQLDLVQPTVTSGDSYVVPAIAPATALSITSWSHNAMAGAGQTLTMKVFRTAADPATYSVVAHDGPQPLTGGTLNTFPAEVPVQPGDVLGLNSANSATVDNNCAFDVPGETVFYSEGSLPDGAAAPFSPDGGYRTNVSAVVEPTSTFTMGKLRRNVRKGTATLTVTVPNPGTLTVAGKGVKRASSGRAGVAKKVKSAGKVKLPIKPKGRAKLKLTRNGKVGLKLKVRFTPTGGSPRTLPRKLKLKLG